MSEGPFSDDPSDTQNPYAVTSMTMAPSRAPSKVGHVQALGILMIIQGVLVTLYGFMILGFAFWMPSLMTSAGGTTPNQPGAPMTIGQMQVFIFILYAGMGVVSLVLGGLNIFAGIRVMQFRNRIMGVVALSAGIGTIFGGCYCLPTAIGLCVYGLIVLLNESVRAAFELQPQGLTPPEIRARFSNAP